MCGDAYAYPDRQSDSNVNSHRYTDRHSQRYIDSDLDANDYTEVDSNTKSAADSATTPDAIVVKC